MIIPIVSTDINALHRQAMKLVDSANALARLKPKDVRIAEILHTAYQYEARAARLCPLVQPSHAVLHRSAATLALDCDEVEAVQELVDAGLAGNLPEEIAVELRDILRRVSK